MTPYYDHAGITIYHGDCREILPMLPDDALLGALVTDPPYGIGADRRQSARANKQCGNAAAPSRDYGPTDWDSAPADSMLLRTLVCKAEAIVWGGNYFDLPASTKWLVWDKQTGSNGYADAELAWTNLSGAVRTFRYQWMGMLQAASDDGDHRVHPTQKPVALMRWCLAMTEGAILDPFMGSGTTLRAAKDLGRKAIGIEIEERYCEIAAKRLAQEVLAL